MLIPKSTAHNTGNRLMQKILSGWILCSLLIGGCQAPQTSSQDIASLVKQVTVRVDSADKTQSLGGSGVIIGYQNNHYFVITNNHVVGDRSLSYKIHTTDGHEYSAKVISPPTSAQEKDLALLSFKAFAINYKVIETSSSIKTYKNETVVAAGFPFLDDFTQSPDLKVTTGKLMMALDKPFIGGYGVGYTNDLKSGMSGGPVFNQKGDLIAINGMPQNPLLGNPYIFEDGTEISEKFWESVSQLSWGIPRQLINNFVQIYYPKEK
jgi:S1-C subfamily serine protease